MAAQYSTWLMSEKLDNHAPLPVIRSLRLFWAPAVFPVVEKAARNVSAPSFHRGGPRSGTVGSRAGAVRGWTGFPRATPPQWGWRWRGRPLPPPPCRSLCHSVPASLLCLLPSRTPSLPLSSSKCSLLGGRWHLPLHLGAFDCRGPGLCPSHCRLQWEFASHPCLLRPTPRPAPGADPTAQVKEGVEHQPRGSAHDVGGGSPHIMHWGQLRPETAGAPGSREVMLGALLRPLLPPAPG